MKMDDWMGKLNQEIEFKPFFRWYNLWIGAYIDRANKTIYICPIPMFGVKIAIKNNLIRKRVNVYTGYGVYNPVALIHTKHNYAIVPDISYGVAGVGGAPWPLEYRNGKREITGKSIIHHWVDRRNYRVCVIDDPDSNVTFVTEVLGKSIDRLSFKEAYELMMENVRFMEKH